MEIKYGIWSIKNGKGDRMYINCHKREHANHPEDLCEGNGLCLYNGWEHLKDLAIAILKYERLLQKDTSIINNIDKEEDDESKMDK